MWRCWGTSAISMSGTGTSSRSRWGPSPSAKKTREFWPVSGSERLQMLAEAAIVNSPRRDSTPRHQAVLLRESLELLAPPRGGTVIDCTVGMGGHTRALLEAVGPSGRVLGLDRDSESLALAAESLKEFGDSFLPFHADYRDLARIIAEESIGPVHALLADFGFSSFQMD